MRSSAFGLKNQSSQQLKSLTVLKNCFSIFPSDILKEYIYSFPPSPLSFFFLISNLPAGSAPLKTQTHLGGIRSDQSSPETKASSQVSGVS